jgi:hypothetical protein
MRDKAVALLLAVRAEEFGYAFKYAVLVTLCDINLGIYFDITDKHHPDNGTVPMPYSHCSFLNHEHMRVAATTESGGGGGLESMSTGEGARRSA